MSELISVLKQFSSLAAQYQQTTPTALISVWLSFYGDGSGAYGTDSPIQKEHTHFIFDRVEDLAEKLCAHEDIDIEE